jgi:hypothetical protein
VTTTRGEHDDTTSTTKTLLGKHGKHDDPTTTTQAGDAGTTSARWNTTMTRQARRRRDHDARRTRRRDKPGEDVATTLGKHGKHDDPTTTTQAGDAGTNVGTTEYTTTRRARRPTKKVTTTRGEHDDATSATKT